MFVSHVRLLSLLSLCCALAACDPPSTGTGTTPAPDTKPEPKPDTKPDTKPEPTPEPKPEPKPEPSKGILGAWTSPPCGARTYPRTFDFAAAGTFTSEDLVSPCPKDVDCVWSGIVDREGTWVATADRITLTDRSEPNPAAKPLPATLGVAAEVPFESGPGGKPCPFTR